MSKNRNAALSAKIEKRNKHSLPVQHRLFHLQFTANIIRMLIKQ